MCDKTKALHDAIKVADDFWDEYSHANKSNAFWNVFWAIVELTKYSPELAADKAEECYFSTAEVWKKFKELEEKKEGTVDSSRLSKEYKILCEHLETLKVMLTRIAIDSGISLIPTISKEKNNGGQGKQTNYRLTYEEIDVEIEASKPNSEEALTKNSAVIEWYIESTPKLLFWSNWLQSLNVEKYRLLIVLFTASPFFVAFLGLAVFWFMAIGVDLSFGWTVIGVCTIYVTIFMLLFRYFITAIENNIALLPDWMLPLKLSSAVLQYELYKPGTKKSRLKNLSVKVYSAKCPTCGHRIVLKSKGLPFQKRLIGICDLNPVEHRYSFDFTNLKGKKIQ